MVQIGAILYSNPFAALVVGALLFAAGRPIIVKVAALEGKPWLVRILTISLALHLLAGPGQIWVIDHFYHGVADWNRYVSRGAVLAPNFRHFDFHIVPGSIGGIVNNGSVSIAAGIVFAIFGINQIAAFFVFGWLSWLGTILFFRAFSLTFGGVGSRRYAYLIFFLPSIIFWTADTSKEAIMLISLGVASYGAARVLAHRRGGISLVIVGCAIGILVRPNELLVAMAGFTVAMMVSPTTGRRETCGNPAGGAHPVLRSDPRPLGLPHVPLPPLGEQLPLAEQDLRKQQQRVGRGLRQQWRPLLDESGYVSA